jgi:2-oxoglutarate ferredoxin oxidoreductase subunit alpha
MQCKWGSHGDYHNIAICPWSVQEMYDLTIRAFNLAEQYRVPVILLSDAAMSRLEERIEISKEVEVFDREEATEITPDTLPGKGIQPMPRFGKGLQVRVSGLTRGYYYGGIEDTLVSQTLVTRIHDKILDNKDKIIEYDSYYMDDAKIAVIAYGFTARSALYAINQLRENGKKNVGMLRLKTIWPFPDKLIAEVGSQGKTIFMPEMNMGQLAGESRKYTCADVISYSQCNGDIIHPKTIMEELRRLL